MTDPHAAAASQGSSPAHHVNYKKVWAILVACLILSVAGTFTPWFWMTLLAAFGIALYKAYLVAKNFMHLDIEKRFVVILLVTMLGLMGLMFLGVSPDVMRHEGQRWENRAAEEAVKRGETAAKQEGEVLHHGPSAK
jgi:caa(3)-type oxidase subunit IV